MTVVSHLSWVYLILSSVFQATCNIHGYKAGANAPQTGISDIDRIISQLPILLPEGIDPKNVNVTTIIVKNCIGMKEQLVSQNLQIQRTTARNTQLDQEAVRLRAEVRLLNIKAGSCSATAAVKIAALKAELNTKINLLQEMSDNNAFLTLKITALTSEVNILQEKLARRINTTGITELQTQLEVKTSELRTKTEQLTASHHNSQLILQIITLQNQIWDLERTASSTGTSSQETTNRIQGLQGLLDHKIIELRGKEDVNSVALQMMSLNSKIPELQKLIAAHIKQSRTQAADLQERWRKSIELLKNKILQLSQEENNTELTQEILNLQNDMDSLRRVMSNARKTTDDRLKELRGTLSEAQKQQNDLKKQLDDIDFTQAELIVKIISIIKEVREFQDDEQDGTTVTTQVTTLQTQLRAKEKECAKTQAEVKDLYRQLQLKKTDCAGLQDKYHQVKTELEEMMTRLNRTGDHKAALVLTIIRLNDELKALQGQINTTGDPREVSELQRQLEKTMQELNAKNAELETVSSNPKIVLRIIALQNEIWGLHEEPVNKTAVDEWQKELDGLINEIEDKGNDNTKLLLKIITLQSQVAQLQRQLSTLRFSQSSQLSYLTNLLATKDKELQEHVDQLYEKDETIAETTWSITNLQNELRKIEKEKHEESKTSSATIATLQTQLRTKDKECARTQAEVKELYRQLKLTETDCAGLQDKYHQVKTELEDKMTKLNRTGDPKASLVLTIIRLNDELKALQGQINTTGDPREVSELQRQLEKTMQELNAKNAELETVSSNPKIVLRIIALQNEIWGLHEEPVNKTAVDGWQKELDGLINEIEDKGNDNTKLLLKIITLQSQVAQLQRQLSTLRFSQSSQLSYLTNLLATKDKELQEHVDQLYEKDETIAETTLSITNIQNELRKIEKEKHEESKTSSATIAKLMEQLKEKVEENSRSQAQIKDLQNKINQGEEQCSGIQEKHESLQKDLDAKVRELEDKSDTVTSLALQVSTLTTQLEALKKINVSSETKVKELQKTIEEKNNELAKKTEELRTRSAQPHRLLQIIALQTQIDKLQDGDGDATNHEFIDELENRLNRLIDGIQEGNNETTKLMFSYLARQDEVARLQKRKDDQIKTHLDRIEELESELKDSKKDLNDKTNQLDRSEGRIANLMAQIMELHNKIKRLENELSNLNQTSVEQNAELEKKLDLKERQLQDSQALLKESDATNFQLMMDVTNLRAQLKQSQKKASKTDETNKTNELKNQLQTQEKDNRRLKNKNTVLEEEIKELQMCCRDNSQCEDIQRQLEESQEKEAHLRHLLGEMEREKNTLQDNYNSLENEKNKLQGIVEDLHNKIDVEDKTIHPINIALDPDTANKRIILSAGDTQITIGEENQNLPDSSRRFDVALSVLGKTGFTSGRHYWEVSVAGKLCYNLGMIKESAQRTGLLKMKPAYGFWTLTMLKQGNFRALDRIPVIIPQQVRPNIVGVLLDYKKGQISFYDVGNRVHIYSFIGQRFTEKIYPFITICVEDGENESPIIFTPTGPVDWIQ